MFCVNGRVRGRAPFTFGDRRGRRADSRLPVTLLENILYGLTVFRARATILGCSCCFNNDVVKLDQQQPAFQTSPFSLAHPFECDVYNNYHQHCFSERYSEQITRICTLTMETPEPEIPPKELSLAALENRLDELWETYLGLLDHYTKAQEAIKTHMNSGFLSLAKAQASAPLGRRYGQDWYDDRMKSSRRVHVLGNDDDRDEIISSGLQKLVISHDSDLPDGGEKSFEKELDVEREDSEPTQQPSPPGTPEPESKQEPAEDEKSDQKEIPKLVNPLRWYGILVPPELRKAQSSFSLVFDNPSSPRAPSDTILDFADSPLTRAINAARDLRDTEVEIRKVRKAVKKAEKARIASSC